MIVAGCGARGNVMRVGRKIVTTIFGFAIQIAAAQAQDAANGEEIFKKCRACHMIGPDAQNRVGPVLNGVIGRKAGMIEGFSYSDANKEAGAKGLVWTEDVLFKYLEKPMVFLPKTKMAFAGLTDEADRKDVIAYLKQFTAK